MPKRLPNAGIMDMIARKMEPGRVTFDMMASRYSTVFFPGFTPGMKPPFLFISSAIMVGFTVTAV